MILLLRLETCVESHAEAVVIVSAESGAIDASIVPSFVLDDIVKKLQNILLMIKPLRFYRK